MGMDAKLNLWEIDEDGFMKQKASKSVRLKARYFCTEDSILSAIPAWQSSSTGSSVTNGTFVCAIVNDGERNPDLSTTTPLPKFCQAGIAGIF